MRKTASLFGTRTITQTTASEAKEGPLVCFTGCRPGRTEAFDTSHRTMPTVKLWRLHKAWTGDASVWTTCKISLLQSEHSQLNRDLNDFSDNDHIGAVTAIGIT